MFIYIGGIPGSGKTSILRSAYDLAQNRNIQLQLVVGATILMTLAGASNMDELRCLPDEVRQKYRPDMYSQVYEEDRNQPMIKRLYDGHFVYYDVNGEKYNIRQIQPWDQEQMRAFVVVYADPYTILERRIKDVHRADRQKRIDFIVKELEMESKIAKEQSERLNIPILFLDSNKLRTVKNIAEQLLSFVEKIY